MDDALNAMSKHNSNISILHCVSEYPTQYKNVNLNTIKYLQKNYGQYTIGYSDHTIGIATPLAAVAMGAEIIEKHITIDRLMKGTDQAGSLAIEGISRMIRDIRNLEMSMGKEEIFICDNVAVAKEKLERSVALLKNLKKGDLISEKDLHLLSPGNGLKWAERNKILGRRLNKDIPQDELIRIEDVE